MGDPQGCSAAELGEILDGMRSGDPLSRGLSLRLLERVRASCDAGQLMGALGDDDPEVVRWAACGLGLRGFPRSLTPLLDMTTSDDPTRREVAADALGLLGDVRAISALVVLIEDPDARVRRAAAVSLKRLGDERGSKAVCDDLVSQLRDGNAEERAFAARALGALCDRSTTAALVESLSDACVDVRTYAAEALGNVADPSATGALLSAGFRDDDETVRSSAMAALGRMSRQPGYEVA